MNPNENPARMPRALQSPSLRTVPLHLAGERGQVDDESASSSVAVINFEMIDDQMAEILSRKTDIQRLRSVDSFWRSARAILRAAILTEHSDWDRAKINKEVARRISNGVVQDA